MSDRFDEKVENIRQVYLMIGEAMDAWRIMPRTVIILYIWWVERITTWFMAMEPVFDRADCVKVACTVLIPGPTVEHTAVILGVIGLAAGIFAFYLKGGRDWDTPIISWKHMVNANTMPAKKEEEGEPEDVTTATAEVVVTKAADPKPETPLPKAKPKAKSVE